MEQRRHDLRELFNVLRYVVRYRVVWCAMPNDLTPWSAIYQQSCLWKEADCFEALASDFRAVLRLASCRRAEHTAAILDSRTLRLTPKSGPRVGYDRAKRKKGSKLPMAVDTFGHLLAPHVTPANRDDRAEIGRRPAATQDVTDKSVELVYAYQGYTNQKPAEAARAHGIALEVVKLPETKRGFVLLPRGQVAELSFAWTTRCRRLLRITIATLQRSQVSMSLLSHAACSKTPLSSLNVHN